MNLRLAVIFGIAALVAQAPAPPQHPGRARVLVQLRSLDPTGAAVARGLGAEARVARRFSTLPLVALEVTPAARAALQRHPGVARVWNDEIARPVLAQSVPQIQADQVWSAGYDGAATTIAIVDTGVDAQHPFLLGKVVDEACFSSTFAGVSQSTCPNGTDEQLGFGAAAPCSLADCLHGTHVAGIAAGNGSTAGVPFSGVARGANVMAIQVFSIVTDAQSCGGSPPPCPGAYSSDIIAGLEYVYTRAATFNVAAANLSLGGTSYAAPCDDQPYKPAIDSLRAIGVASVIASGNEFNGNAIASPACVSSAISVGSVDKTNTVSYFSNVASFLSLFAPGDAIRSSVPGGGFAELSGTSMAAPHVAGVWAALHAAAPNASVSSILAALRTTGMPITDDRLFFGGGQTVPRVSAFAALASLVPVSHPAPTLTACTPDRLRAGATSPVALTCTGSGFDALSAASWNGQPKPTTVVSASQVQFALAPSDITGSSGTVVVTNPAPGGGASNAVAIPIDPPPTLVPNVTTAAPGSPITVTLANGLGGAGDWIGFAATSAANSSYITFTYVGTAVTSRTWTVTAPSTPGTYEFRLFPNNTYTRIATSATVTVGAGAPPPTSPAVITVSSTTVAPGANVTATLTNAPGGQFDWLALAPTSASNSTYTTFTYVGAGASTRTWTVKMPMTPGTYEFRLFLNNGYTRAATSPTVTVSSGGDPNATPPSFTLSATTVAPREAITVTLSNAPGGAFDWIGFASTTAANTSYITFTYVGSGATTKTWTVMAPATPGTYEFRLFQNNGYTRLATSPPVTVR